MRTLSGERDHSAPEHRDVLVELFDHHCLARADRSPLLQLEAQKDILDGRR
jgi:hypothetical protein